MERQRERMGEERQTEGENEGKIIIKILCIRIFMLADAPTIIRN